MTEDQAQREAVAKVREGDGWSMRDAFAKGLLTGLMLGTIAIMLISGYAHGKVYDQREEYWVSERNHARDVGRLEGRCMELCQPETFDELRWNEEECLCATKRVRLVQP